MEIKNDILWRVYLCFLGMIVLGLIVVGRTFYIQQVQGKYWASMGDSLHLKYFPIDAERGTIYSEDGNMLSTSVPVFDVFVDFAAEGLREKNGKRFRDNKDSLSICLAGLFNDKTAKAYLKEMERAYASKDRYYSLKKKITFSQYKELREFPLVNLGKNKSGFIINSRDKRINPYVLLANRTIGLSRDNAKNNVGLEQYYDSLLRGKTGQQLVRYIAGAYIPVDGGDVDPENGKDIISTLDTYMQDVTESALMKMMIGNNSMHGTVIVMETATGKIKAIANLGKQADGTYTEDLNYGIGKATEPGSVFKLATLMSLLEDKYADINTTVDCEGGTKQFYGLSIHDTHPYGSMTLKEAFAASSNVAFAKLADQYYHEQPSKFIDHLHKFRLDQMTGIDITASSGRPYIKKAKSKSWSKTTIPFMAHGYEELVTPLHMLMLYNAVANNGKMMKPYLVSSIREYGMEIRSVEPQVLVEKICSDETLAQVKECLLAVVESEHGTAHKIKDSSYLIAGKTGTAVTALDNKGYNKGNKIYQASFIGYFPANQPKYTMAVVIQNSRESRMIYGADVSGTVFKEISDRIYSSYIGSAQYVINARVDSTRYNYFGMQNEMNSIFSLLKIPFIDSAASGYWRSVQLKNNSGILNTPGISTSAAASLTPNVVGLGLKDAVYMLENMGMRVSTTGRGRVVNQSLAAGTNFTKAQNISLILN